MDTIFVAAFQDEMAKIAQGEEEGPSLARHLGAGAGIGAAYSLPGTIARAPGAIRAANLELARKHLNLTTAQRRTAKAIVYPVGLGGGALIRAARYAVPGMLGGAAVYGVKRFFGSKKKKKE